MAIEFKLPELGENIESADVLTVLVSPGDRIQKEQGVIEIETDKATIEVPSAVTGTIKEVLIKAGDKVKVGQAIITVEESGGKKEDMPKEQKSSAAKTEKSVEAKLEKKPLPKEPEKKQGGATVEMKMPELGENIDSADVLNVLVKAGDVIEKNQGILEIETDKATIEVPSAYRGKVVEVLVNAGAKAAVGQPIIKIELSEEEEAEAEPVKKEITEIEEKSPEHGMESVEQEIPRGVRESILPGEKDSQPPITKGAAPAAPSVRRIARELGVDVNKVHGTGPAGRISMDDVKNYVKRLNEERSQRPAAGIKQEPLPDFAKFGAIEKKPMSSIRSKTAEHLSYAWTSVPHVTQHDKADISELEKMRKASNPKVEKAGGKLTVTAILLKIIASALKVFPQFNASIDMEKKEIIYKNYFNIGIAVDTEHGLIVPVIKEVDKKNLFELSVEMNTIAEKARIRKISLEELQGGCFTITNLGGIGGTYFTPIINSPEVAILGVSRSLYEPVFIDGKFEPRLTLPLSLSYDHRIIDGADAARFLRWVCEALEQPMKILIEG